MNESNNNKELSPIKLYICRKNKPEGKVSYYTPITSEYNGRKSTYYLLVNFKKGVELYKNTTIELKRFYFGSYFTGDVVRLKIIITDFNIVEKESTREVFNEYNKEKEEYLDSIGF